MKIGDLYVPVQLDPLHCEESGFGECMYVFYTVYSCCCKLPLCESICWMLNDSSAGPSESAQCHRVPAAQSERATHLTHQGPAGTFMC